MTIRDLLNCTRPIRWENDDDEYPYSIGGTGFLAKYGTRRLFITAKHCIGAQQRTAEELRVAIVPGTGIFDAFAHIHYINGHEDWSDLVFVEFDTVTNSPESLASPDFLDLDAHSSISWDLGTESRFFGRGYPTDPNEPNYRKRILRSVSFSFSGGYDSTLNARGCVGLRLDARGEDFEEIGLKSLDGLSGSPVFEQRNGPMAVFRGMIIKGEGNRQRFIGAPVIFKALATQFGPAV